MSALSDTQLDDPNYKMSDSDNKVKGVTFSGETFNVPETHDMVKTLFDPFVRKSVCEIIIVSLLLANGLVFWLIDSYQLQIKVFIGLYIFWRFSYNFGIGWMLNQQSNHHKLVNWSAKSRIFSNDNHSLASQLAKLEIHSQMGSNYSISNYPIEFNTWLLFRKVVDLILMSDFTTFICLVVSCSLDKDYQFVHDQPSWLINSRLVLGVTLILFNLWVKINAHNTIKDYAWYWGDFFFRQINNEELIFDGVFEMVPHPMYSVGYIGYYGFALISKSYTVLVVALFGHFLQMIFLHYIENPHIDKIYGPSETDTALAKIIKLKDLKNFDNVKPLVGLWNFNWLRASDSMNLILSLTYAVIIPFIASVATIDLSVAGYTITTRDLLFWLTVGIKTLQSFSINSLLILQSHYKTFTKWYLSNNIPVVKSLNNWSILYNSLINLTYSSFIGFNIYNLFANSLSSSELLIHDYLYLRVFIGVLMVVTQIWINTSIIDSIGYFGWFYGDFFIPKSSLLPQRSNLTKAGVYRYLNNPEQIFGVCGVVGITLVIPSVENLAISLIWVGDNFLRINFIEKSHMIKIYGESEVLQDSGVTKTFKKHLLPDVIQRRISSGNLSPFEDTGSPSPVLKRGRRRSSVLSESIDHFIKELNNNFNHNKVSKINLFELSQSSHFASSAYRLQLLNLSKGDDHHFSAPLGSPIKVTWNAPENHSPQDWVGLYKIIQTSYSRNKTLISSYGRWNWTGSGPEGEMTFHGKKLFWDEGIYEFRYHLDGKHEVAYISPPFEINSVKIKVPNTKDDVSVDEFAQSIKREIFDRVVTDDEGRGKVTDIDTPLSPQVLGGDSNVDVIDIYEKIALLISKATSIKINSRFLVYYENENSISDDKNFNIKNLSVQLINIKKILRDLSHEEDTDFLQSKKKD